MKKLIVIAIIAFLGMSANAQVIQPMNDNEVTNNTNKKLESMLKKRENEKVLKSLSKSDAVDNRNLDLIIQKLETTGKLDAAINRVIDRRIKAEKDAQAHAAIDQEKKNKESAKDIVGFSEKEHYLGDKTARYSVIVYEDMECPFCKVYAEVPPIVISKLKDVNFVSRPNPLQFHMPAAAKEAVLAECVANELGNDGYFKFTREIFKNTLTNGQGLPALPTDYQFKGTVEEKTVFQELKSPEKALFAVAKETGVKDISQTSACYKDVNTSLSLQTLIQYSANHGITGTPTTILKDNQTGKSEMLPGVMSEEELTSKLTKFILAK